MRDSRLYLQEPPASFWRSLQTLNISRVVIAASLLLLLNLRSTREVWAFSHLLARDVCAVYLLTSVGFTVLKVIHPRRFIWQLLTQISWDLLIIGVIYLGGGGARGSLGILFLFPLAGVAILAPLIWALFFCALVSLYLLLVSAYQTLEFADEGLTSQAGLVGAAFFAVVVVVSRLASNLIRQEQIASERGAELAMQQAINRLVIADMSDGILVLDQEGRVFELNPAAQRMLGGHLTQGMIGRQLAEVVALRSLVDLLADMRLSHSRSSGKSEPEISFVSIPALGQEQRALPLLTEEGVVQEWPHLVSHLRLRATFIGHQDGNGGRSGGDMIGSYEHNYTIVFLQDVSDIENQAQQLKLASMGRLTASIAHEVRNPLSSISYAASLLNEDLAGISGQVPQARRLLSIVDDNVGRLNQLIEDILKLSRKAKTDVAPYMLMTAVQRCVQDFSETRAIRPELILVRCEVDFMVVFDPDHLIEVLTNLLSNAIRYASGKPGSVRLFALIGSNGRQELHIQDDGAPISYDVRAHLFEPFYTTSRMGTGLGLYMARELCLNNRSLLDYEYRVDEADHADSEPQGRFVINFSGSGN